MATKDGYELNEGDTFYVYVETVDGFIGYKALAFGGGYVYYDATPKTDDGVFARKLVEDVYKEKPRTLYELLADAKDIERAIACCGCEEYDVCGLVAEAFDLGRETA